MRCFGRCFVLCLLFYLAPGVAHGAAQSLGRALDLLRSEGTRIAFSSELVRPDMSIDVPYISFDTVRDALPQLGLAFRQSGNRWLIVPAPKHPARVDPVNAPNPTIDDTEQIETVIVTG